MGQFEINLPETLRVHLEIIAQKEKMPLNQYIVYALTRQAMMASMFHTLSKEERAHQREDFEERLQRLGEVSSAELELILREREPVEPDPDLDPEVISRLQYRIAEAKLLHEQGMRDLYDNSRP